MENLSPIKFKNLKPHIADAIKESCYRTDARVYNIANEVHQITTMSVEPGVEMAEGFSKIVDKTVKEAMQLDCDLAVIAQGLLLGAFRASPFIAQEAHKTIHILIREILQSVSKYKGSPKQTVKGILAGMVIVANEFKLNMQEALKIAKEDLLLSAGKIDSGFSEDIKKALADLDRPL